MNERDLKFVLLANELEATINHAEEVYKEMVALAIEKEIEDAIDKLIAEQEAIDILRAILAEK